jgi:hypothetical protein
MNRPSVSSHLPATHAGSVWRWIKWSFVVVILAAIAIVVRIVQIEIDTLRLQARYLSELTRDIGFAVEPGRATVPLSRDEWSSRRAARLCGAPRVHPERVNEFATPGCLHSMSKRQVLCWFGIPSVWVG